VVVGTPALPGIEVQGLTKRFGAVLAVDDLSFRLQPGTVTGFLGPNGAGKTTTLRMLLGLVRPSTGRALVNGTRYQDLADPIRAVGAVLESSGFHPARSARNHLRTIAVVDGIGDARVEEVLGLVGLADDAGRHVGGYSMGMRQRLELARAMLGDPEVLVLDEPANGLDPQGIAWLRGFLRWFAALGRVVFISSHLLAEAAQTVDDVIVLNRGRVVGQGPLAELRRRAAVAVQVRTTEPDRLAGLLTAAGAQVRRVGDDQVEASGTSPEAVGTLMAEHRIVVLEMTSSGESLEQLFFELTSAPGAATAPAAPRPQPGADPAVPS
jgi:ABC-2 type transport system ATP-binding protein